MTATRKQMLQIADDILAANPEEKEPAVRIRYRGGRPAMNWLAKHDARGAACLWRIARERLPAANDNLPIATGLSLDRRKDGKPRGPNRKAPDIGAYLALPAVQARLGDPEPEPVASGNWDSQSRGITIKPQRQPGDYAMYPHGSFTKCLPAVADGAFFIGAEGGLGQPKKKKRRGDIRRMDGSAQPEAPDDIDAVIEVILAGGNVADVGEALGANGGYADRKGGEALLAAGRWAASNDNQPCSQAA